MSGAMKKLLIYFVLPAAAIAILFTRGTLPGIAGIIAYLAYILFINRTRIFSMLGCFFYSKRDFDKSLLWFKRAYMCKNAGPKIITSYAYLLLKSGNIDESEKILNNLLSSKLKPDDMWDARSNLALVLWKKGELDNAIAMLEEVIRNYKTSTVYGSLGYLLIKKGDLNRALEFNLEAYDYNSSNAVILDNLGQTYCLLGEYEKAAEIYEKLMQSKPSFPEAYYNYGLVLAHKGEREKALKIIRKALDFDVSFLSTVSKDEIESAMNKFDE